MMHGKPTIAAFTGSGTVDMTDMQCRGLTEELIKRNVIELHLGDCIHADFQAHRIASLLRIRTIGHPPTIQIYRAFCGYDEVRLALPYLVRNRAMVDEAELLIVGPHCAEYQRSGTWSTKRYAVKTGKLICILMGWN